MLIYADGIQILPLAPDMHDLTSLIKSDSKKPVVKFVISLRLINVIEPAA